VKSRTCVHLHHHPPRPHVRLHFDSRLTTSFVNNHDIYYVPPQETVPPPGEVQGWIWPADLTRLTLTLDGLPDSPPQQRSCPPGAGPDHGHSTSERLGRQSSLGLRQSAIRLFVVISLSDFNLSPVPCGRTPLRLYLIVYMFPEHPIHSKTE
jgi:hypothetical protein